MSKSIVPYPIRVAADIGGTFTDVFVLDLTTDRARAFKTPTTPDDPSIGLMVGLSEAASAMGFALGDISLIIHGTTIATNAVLENKLAKGALITTAGFEDVLEIGRHVRHDVYGLTPEARRLLIPREHRLGANERIAANGDIALPLDPESVKQIIDGLKTSEIDAVAICFLHAYANDAHEQALKSALAAAMPDLPISLSSEVSPEIREFERASTTALNALLTPVLQRYAAHLSEKLERESVNAPVYLVRSNGGVANLDDAARMPAALVLSGPCGGTIAAGATAGILGERNLVAIDMGGTSFDVSLIHNGRAEVVTEGELGGVSVRLPMVEIRTIGAGGGSIASIDATGRLRVGPESAGAQPGPACYSRGGTAPTVTDANVVLGRLSADAFLSGAMQLDHRLATESIESAVAKPMGMSVQDAAQGVVSIAETAMAAAIRLSLFEKGLDPQDFAIISFGGAAGLHATQLAQELDIGRVIFPRDPSTLSAYGMLHADIAHDLSRTRVMAASADNLSELLGEAALLKETGDRKLDADRVPAGDRAFRFSVDMRYQGQAYEVMVPWPDIEGDDGLDKLIDRFHEIHLQRFAHGNIEAPVEIVTLRLSAVGLLAKPEAPAFSDAAKTTTITRRDVMVASHMQPVLVINRDDISPGSTGEGPVIIEEAFTTLFIPPNWTYRCDSFGIIIATHNMVT